jgi:hypothetical protein
MKMMGVNRAPVARQDASLISNLVEIGAGLM